MSQAERCQSPLLPLGIAGASDFSRPNIPLGSFTPSLPWIRRSKKLSVAAVVCGREVMGQLRVFWGVDLSGSTGRWDIMTLEERVRLFLCEHTGWTHRQHWHAALISRCSQKAENK